MTTTGHDLILRDVTFAYGPHSEPVLRKLDLTVPAGDHLAVVGPSGIGKSTLASLLCGLRRPTSGTVHVGDAIAADLSPDRLAEIRTLIPQEAYVFASTIWDNLTYLCSTATPRQVDNAVSALGADPMIAKLGGVSAELIPAELSAGERQLIALVRSYISPAPVVVLDEATCHLDPVAERCVEEAFAERRGTLIVIAHRISSALRSRRVLVLDGVSAALGDQLTLLATSPLYRELLGHWQAGSAVPNKADERLGAVRRARGPANPSRLALPVTAASVPAKVLVGAGVGSSVSTNGAVSINGTGPGHDAVPSRLLPRDDRRPPRRSRPQPADPTPVSTSVQDVSESSFTEPVASIVPTNPGGTDRSHQLVIFGQVTSDGQTPLSEATVTLTDPSGAQLDRDCTDSGGHYRLSPPRSGSYLVICAATPHQPTAALVTVADGPVRRDVVLSRTGASLSGTVSVKETGLPVEGAVVTLIDLRGEVVGAAATELDGRFVFFDLTQGLHTLTVAAPSLQPVAESVDVPPSGQVIHDVQVAARVRLIGAVRSATAGAPVSEALATLIASDGHVVASVLTEPDGGFAFDDLRAGVYTVIATGYPSAATEVHLSTGEPTETVITLSPPAPGSVVGPGR